MGKRNATLNAELVALKYYYSNDKLKNKHNLASMARSVAIRAERLYCYNEDDIIMLAQEVAREYTK